MKTAMSESELWTYLSKTRDFRRIDRTSPDFPMPYYESLSNMKAIVLGADPSNPSGRQFERVFGLENPKSPYFRRIKTNLSSVGLSVSEVYIQNLCRNYFTGVTDENDEWEEVAGLWIPILKNELDSQFDRNVPVLLTAKKLFNVLVSDRNLIVKPVKEFYREARIVQACENTLGRTLVPFYRHQAYRLELWPDYQISVVDLLRQGRS